MTMECKPNGEEREQRRAQDRERLKEGRRAVADQRGPAAVSAHARAGAA
jgi:hypothetical protein